MSTKPKIIFMPHANIQYSQLPPEKRAWVVHNSYEPLFDLVAAGGYRIAFEASGVTIEFMAGECPKVMAKLKDLVERGLVEPVGSPHVHIMLTNIDPDVGLASLRKGLDTWEKYCGVRPRVGWNPECGWAEYIPEIYKQAGFESLIMDGDSFLLSFDEIRKATGLTYDVSGHSNKNHLFKIEEYIKDKPEFLRHLTNPSRAANGLQMIFRSDCMANPMLWYLMGATEGMRKEPISLDEIRNMLENWKERIAKSGAFIMPYAEDAEYIGTSAYFYVKQFNQARFFEPEPESISRFRELLDSAVAAGYELSTPSVVIADADELPVNEAIARIENGVAWHGGTAKAWANTTYSRILDPVCNTMIQAIRNISKITGHDWTDMPPELSLALQKVTNAFVSDSRWPPAPTSPGRFNVRESIDDLKEANAALGRAMAAAGLEERRGLYSVALMQTQVAAIETELMNMTYFGEE